jgi:hypothetical protein
MRSILSNCRAPRKVACWLGALACALTLAAAAGTSGTASAAPRTTCTNVQCVIQFGDTQITNRLTALSTLCSKVAAQQTANHITGAQAGAISADCGPSSANVTGLTALKAKLDAETTMAQARADVKNIYEQFRIYAVVLPRDYNEVWLDILTNVDQKLRGVQPKIDAAIDAASGLPDKDNDKEKINSAFADFKNQLTAAEGQIDGAQGLIPTLSVSAFNNTPSTYKTDYTDYRNDIHTAHQDIAAATKDLHVVAQALKDLVGDQTGGSRATTKPTPTATP